MAGTLVVEKVVGAAAERGDDFAQLRALGIAAEIVVGSYVTSLEMAGCSITITLLDAAIAELWNAPVHTAALRW